jgi:hypothetical protein
VRHDAEGSCNNTLAARSFLFGMYRSVQFQQIDG